MKNLNMFISRYFDYAGHTHFTSVTLIDGVLIEDGCLDYQWGYGNHGEHKTFEALIAGGHTPQGCFNGWALQQETGALVNVLVRDVKRKKDMITKDMFQHT